jgi:hypothetical protein
MLRRAFIKREVPEVMSNELVAQLLEGEVDIFRITLVDPVPVDQVRPTGSANSGSVLFDELTSRFEAVTVRLTVAAGTCDLQRDQFGLSG